MQETVKQDRWKYIGGSDIAAIMGISKFRTRWDVLQEKAQFITNPFEGNAYTDYGNVMEPKIREFVNFIYGRDFAEGMKQTDDLRFHFDGIDTQYNEVLEIKTTSQIHENVNDYKYYLVQLLAYMASVGAEKGYLAVYERPEDFDEKFYPDLLTVYPITFHDFEDLWQEVVIALNRFREDLRRLQENPLLTEEDMQPKEVIDYACAAVALEEQVMRLKEIEAVAKQAKRDLKWAMEKHGIKQWITNSGCKVTLVPDGDDTVVSEFNLDRFREEQPEMYAQYIEDRMKPGRAGYVRITLPKG